MTTFWSIRNATVCLSPRSPSPAPLARLVPRPDLYILLDVPAELLQQRKPEVSCEESRRQRIAYLQMFHRLPNAFIVDAAGPLDEVARQMKSVILHTLTNRARWPKRSVSDCSRLTWLSGCSPSILPSVVSDNAHSDFSPYPAPAHRAGCCLTGEPQPRYRAGGLVTLSRGFATEMDCRARGQRNRMPIFTPRRDILRPPSDWMASIGNPWGRNSATPPVTAVYLGTPGPSRKAVIHLLDSHSGECHMVVKIPLGQAARTRHSQGGGGLEQPGGGSLHDCPTSTLGRL